MRSRVDDLLAAMLTFDDSSRLALWVFGIFDRIFCRSQIYVKNSSTDVVSLKHSFCNLLSLKELRSTAYEVEELEATLIWAGDR